MRRVSIMVVLVASLLAGACGGDKKPIGPAATLPQPTTTLDPYAIPAVIDEAYVNLVLAGLDQAVGEVLRSVMSSKRISREDLDRLEDIYLGDTLKLKRNILQGDLEKGFPGVRTLPGNQVSRVTDLLSSSVDCIFAAIDRDYAEVAEDQTDVIRKQWIALRRSEGKSVLNTTHWVYSYDGFEQGRLQPRNPCDD